MKVCTVVVTYNRLNLLQNTIEALRAQSVNHDILIINNGSTDGTKEFLEGFDDIFVINQSNVGGAGGFHVGMKYACEHGYDYAWVMDDDVLPERCALQKLLEKRAYLETKEKSVGFVCSNVYNTNGEPVNIPNIDTRVARSTGYATWTKYVSDGIVKVDSSTFVSVLIPCSIIYDLGLPYKEFFIWGDDTEYTLRISNKYPSYLVSDSVVSHLRVGNGSAISLHNMDDPKRIKMYIYRVRNTHYLQRNMCRLSKLGQVRSYMNDICASFKFLLKGNYLKCKVILSGCIKSFTFNPKVEYPIKSNNL